MYIQQAPIGVFDSGAGGVSVLRALQRELPAENFVYYGDNLHAPYGEKDEESIRRLCEADLHFLFQQQVKAVVIACNTATSAAANYLRQKYPHTIIVGMEPAVKPAVDTAGLPCPRVLVMATESTLAGDRLKNLIRLHEDHGEIHRLAAPGIVRLVEAGQEKGEAMTAYLQEILAPYRRQENRQESVHIDSLVLGCTHFPFVKEQIQTALGYPVHFYDGAEGTARETRHRLEQAGLLHAEDNVGASAGRVRLFSSDPRPEAMQLLQRLYQLPIA